MRALGALFFSGVIAIPINGLQAQLDVDTTAVSTATISAVQADALDPFATSNLSVEDIRKQDASQDVPFLLRLTPSAVVTSDAGHGIGYTALRIRGVDQSRINVTINGVPLNDAESQGVFWVDLPDLGSSMTGLQIQRGVGTSTNGPAAFGATVSVNTLGTLAKPGIRAVLGGGSFGSQRRTLAWNTGMLDGGWSFEGRASRITSDGWLDRATSDLSSLYGRVAKRWETGRLSLTTTLGHERTYQAWAGVPQIVADPESTDEDILNWVQGSGEYDYGADTVRVQDMLDRRAQHNSTVTRTRLTITVKTTTSFTSTRRWGIGNSVGWCSPLWVLVTTNSSVKGTTSPITVSIPLSPTCWTRLESCWARIRCSRRMWCAAVGLTTPLGSSWTMSTSTDHVDHVYGVSSSTYEGDHFGELIWMSADAGAQPGDEYYRSVGKKRDLSLYGKWSGMQNDLRWHAEAQWRQVFYSTRGRDNDYSDIDVRDNLSFFNPKAGLTYLPSDDRQAFISLAVAHREPSRADYLDSPKTRHCVPSASWIWRQEERGAETTGHWVQPCTT